MPRLLLQAGDADYAREQAAFAAWAAAAGLQVSHVTAAVRLDRQTLFVATTDKTWRIQLNRIKDQLMFKVNSLLGTRLITRIVFVVDDPAVTKAHPIEPTISFNAPDQQALPLRENAALIPDPELRAVFLRAAGKCLERTTK
ncbi:MAG TPA: DciA family protein [Blastocatellia bacterium]|nr:DciA family protein [Blastocatellia bacterium]